MLDNESSPQFDPKRILLALAVLYLTFVIYGSLVPLRVVPIPLEQAITKFKQIPFLDLGIASRADWIANLLLFIPLSMLWGQLILSPLRHRAKVVVGATILVACLALSLAIEFAQLYFPQRTVSQNDILAETLGGALGLVAQMLWGARLELMIGALWLKESQFGRLTRLLHIYLIGMLLFNVLPLDLTISPVEIYHKWTEGRLVLLPFAGLRGTQVLNLYEVLTDIVTWVPCGMLWMLTHRISIARAVLYGLGAGLAVETVQLFVYSRVTDVTDILLAGIGSLLGVLISRTVGQRRIFASMPSSRLWFSLWGVWLVGIFGTFWFPFEFHGLHPTLYEGFVSIFRLPFVTYYFGTEFHAVNELLRKIGFFLPGGMMWGMGIAAQPKNRGTPRVIAAGLIAIALAAFAVEFGQAFLLQKTGDITDVGLEFFGGFLGLLAVHWLMGHGTEAMANSQSTSPPSETIPAADRYDEPSGQVQQGQFKESRTPVTSSFERTDTFSLAPGLTGTIVLLQSQSFTTLPLIWQALSLGALFLTMLSSRIPYVTPVAYALVTYGLPRYTDHYLQLMNSGALTWIAATGAIGSLAWTFRQPDRMKLLRNPIVLVILLFFAWLFAAWLKSSLDSSLYVADQRHHPILFVHGLLLFLIAALPMPGNKAVHIGIMAIILTPLLRWMLQEHQNIYLDGDLPVIAAIVLPFAILGIRFANNMIGRTGYALVGLLLVALIGFAQNRGAGIALIVGTLFLFRHYSRKFTAITVVGCVMALAIFVLPVDSYFARYSVLWNSEANHATAELDRSTIRERQELWQSGVDMALDHPFFGVGPSNYANMISIYQLGKDNLVAHNSLLSLAAEAGLPSVALYLIGLLLAFLQTEKIARSRAQPAAIHAIAIQAALMTQVAAGMFISRHDQVLQYVLIGAVVSLAVASKLYGKGKKSQSQNVLERGMR